jgi:hypothetical protein
MTLQKDQPKPPQNRIQRIVMWCIFGVVAVLAIISITILIASGTRIF